MLAGWFLYFFSSWKTKMLDLTWKFFEPVVQSKKVTLVQKFYRHRPLSLKSYSWTRISLHDWCWPYDLFQASRYLACMSVLFQIWQQVWFLRGCI